MTRRSPTRRRALAALLAIVPLGVAGCYPASPSPSGQKVNGIYDVFFVGGAIVTVFIWVLIAFVVLRYRRRDDRLPRQVHGYLPLEIAWTVIPAVIVLGLFGLTAVTMGQLGATAADPPVSVHVWAFRWQWRFDYPAEQVSVIGTGDVPAVLVVPVKTPVHVVLDSADVAHSFYVPALLFKRDAIPGITNQFDIEVDQIGSYGGQCAEYCGTGHAAMLLTLKVVSAADYRAWLASQPHKLPPPPPLVGPTVAAP